MYADKLGPEAIAASAFSMRRREADLPIGVSRRVMSGVERVWLNCSVCHVGTYRLPGDDSTTDLSARRPTICGCRS